MKLRARWTGAMPRTGDYLMSPTRPRYAYCVREVTRLDSNVRWDQAQKAEVRHLAITVDRVALGEVLAKARVYAWRWDKRVARARAATGSST